MKILITLLPLLGLLSVVLGWTSTETVEINPDVCVSSDPSVGTVKVGISRKKNSCVRVTCSPGFIELAGCGVASTVEPCYMDKGDLSKPYPDCCPQAVCP